MKTYTHTRTDMSCVELLYWQHCPVNHCFYKNLFVTDGPDDQHTKIRGSELFIIDGKRYLSLKCEATEVHPRPEYSWVGVTCENNDTDQGICLLKPLSWDDGREVHCTAKSNASTHISGRTTVRLNLNCKGNCSVQC